MRVTSTVSGGWLNLMGGYLRSHPYDRALFLLWGCEVYLAPILIALLGVSAILALILVLLWREYIEGRGDGYSGLPPAIHRWDSS